MRPTIGITSGDPSGIGLEVAFKAIPSMLSSARWVLFTDRLAFERNYARFGTDCPVRWITRLEEAADAADVDKPVLFVYDVGGANVTIPWGEVSPQAGQRALAYLEAASDAALCGAIQAIVTAPVSKEAVGGTFAGQTDWLAERAGVTRFAMSFFAPSFKVVLATIHVSLRAALAQISTALYLDLIRLTHSELLRFQFSSPRIAVAAINPHAGEGGLFGREDIDVLAPAVQQCSVEGIDVTGPHSADSLYYRAHTGEFDVVIAPYHDQGLVPIKLIAHGTSTNVTLGLPYVRTSPDHGTAFAIAGQGIADPAGMLSAMNCAADLVRRFTIR
jgi:4-hydroxythreonine-4-phosphate dehydrogenase